MDRSGHLIGRPRRARRLWLAIKEPRVLRLVFLVGYVVTLATGVAALLDPPRTVEGVLGPILSASWALFFVLGGAVGAATVLPGWWQVERYAVAAAMFGIGIFALVILLRPVVPGGGRGAQFWMLAVALLFYVLRLLLIRGHDFEPRR